jgi:hypothetical protein
MPSPLFAISSSINCQRKPVCYPSFNRIAAVQLLRALSESQACIYIMALKNQNNNVTPGYRNPLDVELIQY